MNCFICGRVTNKTLEYFMTGKQIPVCKIHDGSDLEGTACCAVSPNGFGCTLKPDHAGKHVATSSSDCICEVWK